AAGDIVTTADAQFAAGIQQWTTIAGQRADQDPVHVKARRRTIVGRRQVGVCADWDRGRWPQRVEARCRAHAELRAVELDPQHIGFGEAGWVLANHRWAVESQGIWFDPGF